jgi:hypothetical protein
MCFVFHFRISHVLGFVSICDLYTDSPSYVTSYGQSATCLGAKPLEAHKQRLFSLTCPAYNISARTT